jgi:hypothetical protein
MRYTIKTKGHTIASVANLVISCEVAIFISKKEKSEAYIYDEKILIARVIGDTVSILQKDYFKKHISRSVTADKETLGVKNENIKKHSI